MKTYKSFALAFLVLFCVSTISAQSPDKIINKYIKAIGGKKVIGEITSIYAEGKVNLMGMQIPIKMTTLNGKGSKQEMEIMGNVVITCYNDKGGWSINPLAGAASAEDMPESMYKSGKDQIFVGAPFINYAAMGYKAELKGTETVGNSNAYKIIMTSPDNISSTYFFDTKTYLLLQAIQETDMQGQMTENITSFSDYKKIKKYSYPNDMEINIGGGQFTMKITLTKMELNIPVDENIFIKPQ